MKRFLYFFAIFLISYIAFTLPSHKHPTPPEAPPLRTPQEIEIEEPPSQEISVDDAVKSIKAAELKEIVVKLCSREFAGRQTGTQGNELAATYIKNFFNKCGLKTTFQEFSSRLAHAGKSKNIMAYIEGTNKDEIVVVGGHMDHQGQTRQGICYGADDNASGTAAVMEIGKAFSYFKDKLPRTILFQCYNAEEQGLIGSKYYVNYPLFPKKRPSINKHIYMINLDMIGYYKNQNIVFPGTSGGASDHYSFYQKGVPSVFIHTGMHPYYHTPQDTPDKLNYEGMEKITKQAFKLAWEKVQNGHRTEVKEEIPDVKITHDHGNAPFPEILVDTKK